MNKLQKVILGVVFVLGVVFAIGFRIEPWEAENPNGEVSKFVSVELYDFAYCNIGPFNTVCQLELGDWTGAVTLPGYK